MLIYDNDELYPIGCTDSDLMTVEDSSKSTLEHVFTLGG